MYKLIIADDEKRSRELLSKTINWSELGFEVVGLFSCGEEVIEYVQNHWVDCILSDIKMKNSSGIDVAEYSDNNIPRIKVVLISGYQDFCYAASAFRFQVENYLLKPVNIGELKETFKRLSSLFDSQKTNAEIISVYRQEILTNFLLGYYKDEKSIDKAFSDINLGFSAKSSIAIAKIKTYSPVIHENYSNTHFYQNIVGLCVSTVTAFFVELKEEVITYLLFSENPSQQVFQDYAKSVCANITNISSVACRLTDFSYFETALDFCRKIQSEIAVSEPTSAEPAKYKQHILIAISSQDLDMIDNSVNLIAKNAKNMPLTEFIELFKELSASLLTQMQIVNAQDITVFCGQLDHCRNYSSVTNSVINYLCGISCQIHKTDNLKKSILEVRDYIIEHCEDDLSREKLAALIHLSPSYFSKTFKNIVGETYINFIIDCRMNKAKNLLINTNLKINEISSAVGYSTTSSFLKLFKSFCGVTPTEYRNKFARGGY